MSTAFPPGWYQDPTGQGDARYWNGTSWTQSVDRGGVTVNVAIDPSAAQIPPVPGTQVSIPAPPSTSPTTTGGSSKGSAMGIIVGVLVVVVIGILIFAFVNDDSSDDTPTPGSTPAVEAPAPPASVGG